MTKSQRAANQPNGIQEEGENAKEPSISENSGQLQKDLKKLGRLRTKMRRKVTDMIANAAKVEVVGARPVGDTSLALHLLIDGSPLTVEVSGFEVVEGNLDEAARHVKGLRGKLNRVKRPETLSIKELQERNLPLYWNEEWLRAELDRLGSYAEIARVHGFPSPVTIASYAKRKFGIDMQAKFAKKREAVYDDFDTGDFTQLELAQKHGVGVATVYRWLKERSEGKHLHARRGSRATGSSKRSNAGT